MDHCPRRGRAGFHGGARHQHCECIVALSAGSLSAAATDSKYVITSYLSANAVVLPICGWLAAHLGRHRYFLLSIRSGSAFSSSLSSTGKSTRNGTGLEIPLVACRHSPRSRSSAPEPYSLGESPGQPDCKLSSSTLCLEHALARSAAIALRLRRVPRRSPDAAGRNLFHHGIIGAAVL